MSTRLKLLAAVTMSAVVVATGATTAVVHAQTAPAQTLASEPRCGAFDDVVEARYWVNNNLWGQDSGSGTQCVQVTSTGADPLAWSTNWNWTGQSNGVKSFASSVLGWNWGVKIPDTGLPVQLSANRSLPTTWDYRITLEGEGTMNVAYDLWLHEIPDPTFADNPTDEIMIWTSRAGGAGPIGQLQTTVDIAGTTWELHVGNNGWNVFSFIRTENTESVSMDLRDFLNDLIARGLVPDSKFLTSVQAGTEVFIGAGRLDTTAYSTLVQ